MNTVINNLGSAAASATLGFGPLILAQAAGDMPSSAFEKFGIPIGVIVLLVWLINAQGQSFAKASSEKSTEFAKALSDKTTEFEKRIDAVYASRVAESTDYGAQMREALSNEREQSRQVYSDLMGLLRERKDEKP